MTQPCPGVCNAIGGTDPTMGEPIWCRPDQARIRRQLAELDDLAALHAMSADGYGEPTPAIWKSDAAPSPSAIGDDLDELTHFLLDWEAAYREIKDWPSPPRRGIIADTRTTVLAWLGDHLTGMLAAPFAADFGREISAWHRRLITQTKTGTGRHRKPVPCPWCELRMLTWTEGDDYVICCAPGCRCRLTMDEYHALVEHAAVPA